MLQDSGNIIIMFFLLLFVFWSLRVKMLHNVPKGQQYLMFNTVRWSKILDQWHFITQMAGLSLVSPGYNTMSGSNCVCVFVSCKGSRAVVVWWHDWHGAPGPAAFLWGTEQRGGRVRGAAEPEGQVAAWAAAPDEGPVESPGGEQRSRSAPSSSPPACSPHLTDTTMTRTQWHEQTFNI